MRSVLAWWRVDIPFPAAHRGLASARNVIAVNVYVHLSIIVQRILPSYSGRGSPSRRAGGLPTHGSSAQSWLALTLPSLRFELGVRRRVQLCPNAGPTGSVISCDPGGFRFGPMQKIRQLKAARFVARGKTACAQATAQQRARKEWPQLGQPAPARKTLATDSQ